jgi:tyrosyl-tRNA synthetase
MSNAINTDPKKIEEILTRGVANIYNKDELREKLLSGKQLHLKFGTDVTGPLLTLGHSVVHRKIRDFQELGHRVTLVIGDYTTLIGDHSDKLDVRKEIESVDIEENKKTYANQFFKTVLEEGTTIRNNSEWLKPLTFNDVIGLSKQFTISQMLDRETFKLRYEEEKPIRLSEFLYPLMQGYDSVALNNDVEFGGTDQTFNLLAGRHLMGAFNQIPQSCVAMKLLTGNDGRPMGKSLKNYISIMEAPSDMYGKLMSIVDTVLFEYFELVTRIPMAEVAEMKKTVENGANPMEFKKKLAKEVTTFYHGEAAAIEAEKEFERVVQNKDYSEITETFKLIESKNIIDLMIELKFTDSKNQARRLIEQKAVKLNDKTIETFDAIINEEGILKVGKKNIIKITINN